ncbi:MarR family winged helix-turn-helix transcriptional regulator [Micromonospora sp. 4G55]|uniref:MarR family winged helix-turn-helix transcriptional regulator n=1 Tax=Micromonospora sp. 4G55 TaxID=2806102 RepID=UPI001A55763B|nr:MarR family winged helix-turn-helix transcriptional regulator [Micromonospora sp. 4G55]MBM0258114.1 winged helix-turn-helix transcriptional regulator [Micromonospora sp. 4G55]
MTDTPSENLPAHSAFKVLAALAELGEATAATVAEHAGLGYSTTTPKLRAWEGSGQAERLRTGDGRTLWRLTDAGRAATAAPQPAANAPDPAATPEAAQEPSQDGDAPPAAQAADAPASPSAPAPPQTDLNAQGAPMPDGAPAGDTPTGPAPETPSDNPDDARAQRSQSSGGSRRIGGSLRGAILDILEAHPDRAYKTGELCRLIDAANVGTGAAKASAGAVANAATKLVADGQAVQIVERPATYQLAPATGGE